MARRAGGGKYCVEGCRFVDALDLRRKGHLQPPAPGKPPYAITANCGGREQSYCHRLDALQVRRQAVVVPVRVLRPPGYPAVCHRARVRLSPLPPAGL